GGWRPPPSPPSRPTPPGTACRPTSGSGSTSKTSSRKPGRGGQLRPAPRSDLAPHPRQAGPAVGRRRAHVRRARPAGARARRCARPPRRGGPRPPRAPRPQPPGPRGCAARRPPAPRPPGAPPAAPGARPEPPLKQDERAAILADLAPAAVVDEADAADVGRSGSKRLDGRSQISDAGGALILYTSGSTGRPKGALLSHAAVELAIESWAGPGMGLTPNDVGPAGAP